MVWLRAEPSVIKKRNDKNIILQVAIVQVLAVLKVEILTTAQKQTMMRKIPDREAILRGKTRWILG